MASTAYSPRLPPLFPPVLLNIDAGEYPDEPEALYGIAHVVSIACGGHAGDEASMDRVLAACVRFGTGIGAHPSYADREGFGRRKLDVTIAALATDLAEQVARLAARARTLGRAVQYVKPHGALYHAADRDAEIARAVARASLSALGRSFTLVGPPGGELREAAERLGVLFAREGFADRATRPDGSLVPREMPGALIEDPARARDLARRLALSGRVDTVCVHGDTPGALLVAHATRQALDALNADARR